MTKKLILVFIVLNLFLIAGCDVNQRDKNPITDADVRKGTDGLVIEFLKNSPPEHVFEEDIFPIVIMLKNKGASDVENGKLVLGLEKTYVDVSQGYNSEIDFNIKGKSIFNLNGDEEVVTVNAKTKKIGEQIETHSSTILVTACYKYRTILGSGVCIDTDIYGLERGEKACVINDLEFSSGQGAPVAITKVETRILPDVDENEVKPQFIIYIENKGNGEVISLDKVGKACTSEALEYEDFNVMKINAALSDKVLNCNVDGDGTTIRLRDKTDMVRCTLDEGVDKNLGTYVAPLNIELDYGYTFTASKNIIIEKLMY